MTLTIFSDVPHLLKLWRDHYLDTGYVLPNGTKFTMEDLHELKEYDKNEMQVHHKLTEKHFLVKGQDRQRV